MILRTSLVAALLLGAHFLRGGSYAVAALCAGAPLLLRYRRRWPLILLQIFTYGPSAVWIITAIHLLGQRQLEGRPWTAGALILGAVALLTCVAGLLLNSRKITERYPP